MTDIFQHAAIIVISFLAGVGLVFIPMVVVKKFKNGLKSSREQEDLDKLRVILASYDFISEELPNGKFKISIVRNGVTYILGTDSKGEIDVKSNDRSDRLHSDELSLEDALHVATKLQSYVTYLGKPL